MKPETAYSNSLKKWIESESGVKVTKSVVKSARPNPWVQIYVKEYGDSFPNEFRKMIIETVMPDAAVGNWDNISYGNIQPNRLSLHISDWLKVYGDRLWEELEGKLER